MTQSTNSMGAREASRARRRALSATGKSAVKSSQPNVTRTQAVKTTAAPVAASAATAPVVVYQGATNVPAGKAASKARRLAMSSRGKAGSTSKDRSRVAADVVSAKPKSVAAPEKSAGGCGCGCGGKKAECKSQMAVAPASQSVSPSSLDSTRRQSIKMSSGRAASFARRSAMSKRGKAGVSAKGLSAAQTARATNPNLSSRELAKVLRDQRSSQGRCGQKKSDPCGRVRPNKNAAAQDAPWKVGVSETLQGQTLTGTMVGRTLPVTGNEQSTCRDVTGTEYMGADTFREFCQSDPSKPVRKVDVTSTSHGNAVSGNKIGRGENVTGNEVGSCKSVTGNEYMSSNESEAFCGTKAQNSPRKVSVVETRQKNAMTGSNVGHSEKVTGNETGSNSLLTGSQYIQSNELDNANRVPAKVGAGQTLRGGSVSGSMLDRTQHVTGNEAGSCRNVTGDDYVGQEQFDGFCKTAPRPVDNKVELSSTNQGNMVTGVMTDRSESVTGNEPGTCKSVTGTPYASADQAAAFCDAEQVKKNLARNPAKRSVAASVISGIQPSVGGTMTGDNKGACEAVSGTPYVGADQLAQACSSPVVEEPASDFPQSLSAAMGAKAAAVATQPAVDSGAVTGSSYEKGNITGPFGMAAGKVTGTEQARFSGRPAPDVAEEPVMVEGREKSRISGEGMNTNQTITGDDWGRGKNVTGTEGTSAVQRNPSYRSEVGMVSNAAMVNKSKRNDELPVPVSKVTGSSGNTGQGSLITYSGGARG